MKTQNAITEKGEQLISHLTKVTVSEFKNPTIAPRLVLANLMENATSA